LVPDLPPRSVDPQGRVQSANARESAEAESEGSGRDGELIVGKGIIMKGKMERCDTLVVHGQVDAEMSGREIEVGEGGVYTGQAEVQYAHIAGSFDGELTVHGTLSIESTGRVTGQIRYAEVIIDRGGWISGDIQVLDDEASEGADSGGKKKTAAS
jgi:cytoskeletal protein CcmA (bactofilin family)